MPDLIRQSSFLAKRMDARVKPGHNAGCDARSTYFGTHRRRQRRVGELGNLALLERPVAHVSVNISPARSPRRHESCRASRHARLEQIGMTPPTGSFRLEQIQRGSSLWVFAGADNPNEAAEVDLVAEAPRMLAHRVSRAIRCGAATASARTLPSSTKLRAWGVEREHALDGAARHRARSLARAWEKVAPTMLMPAALLSCAMAIAGDDAGPDVPKPNSSSLSGSASAPAMNSASVGHGSSVSMMRTTDVDDPGRSRRSRPTVS